MGSCIPCGQDQAFRQTLDVDGAVPNQAGQVLFLVLPVASWMTLSRALCVAVTLIPLLCNGGLLLGSACEKQWFSNSSSSISFFHIHRRAFVSDRRQIDKQKP